MTEEFNPSARHGDRDGANAESKKGYKNPPKEHRFKKGKSGNPSGKKKHKIKDGNPFIDEMTAQFQGEISAMLDGKRVKIRGGEFFARRVFRDALAEDGPSRRFILNHLGRFMTTEVFFKDSRRDDAEMTRDFARAIMTPNGFEEFAKKWPLPDVDPENGSGSEDQDDTPGAKERSRKRTKK